jgi:NAD(P)-dependent dehydrogenase (short-subunit alcohol dehydrogenase family)
MNDGSPAVRGRLAGKAALVVGATRGIGQVIAETFAREGAAVLLVGRSAAAGEAVARGITSTGGRALFLAGDAREEATAERAVGAALQTWGHLEILVNNAAVDLTSPLVDTNLEAWNDCLAVDLTAAFLACKHAIPAMIAADSGSIVNVASTAATRGVPQHAAYGAAKAGLVNLTKSIVVDYGRHGVRANCICPGAIDTPMLREWLAGFSERRDAVSEQILARIPAGRFGRAEDVAATALFLASDEAAFVSGNVIFVDGGSSA